MEPIYLFDLLNQNRSWLSARQSVTAQNIANANTPRYGAKDIAPFSQLLDKAIFEMAGANIRHIKIAHSDLSPGLRPDVAKESPGWEITHSGNSVSLEQSSMKLAATRGAFSLDTAVLKAFHDMWLSSLKG